MPMNVALGDSSGYNYASGRLDHQTYFRTIKGERTLIEDTILDDLLASWEELDRLFYPDDYPTDAEIEHEWMWDGFAHVDPLKEANAQNVRLNNSKTTTLADECGMEGKDYMKVIRQRVREECAERRLRKQYGLPETQNNPSGTVNPSGEGRMIKMKKNKRITCADERMITLSDPAAKPGKDLAKVDGVACSGGTFRQVWDSRDMAVDLAGMELRSQIPLLLSHMNWPDCRLGVVTADNDGKQLAVSGGIDLSDEQGRHCRKRQEIRLAALHRSRCHRGSRCP